MEAITLKSTYNIKANYTSMKEGLGWDSFPYQPRFDLDPVPIRFEEYISWAGEAKFEFIPEPIFGGGHQSTL